jgi:predicted Fe-Mo cluster-binding NifX family protein
MAYKIAVTSSDGQNIDLHFGRADEFLIFEIEENTGAFHHAETRKIDKTGGTVTAPPASGCIGSRDELLERAAELIADCKYLLTRKIGFKPEKILRQHGVSCLESPPNLQLAVQKLNAYQQKHK